ncbi:glycosyl transferase [Methylocystis rosea]|uniref:peptidoglycan glycosyltransferase n=1 Tax=Methylocystis rosea TaxID=173366 RepID=A0A3G8M800_9HYPH|nr:transglycosylase domain-containing protein [Methylocystis rosea]AZG77322.1 glycosyl transferase [Methylocystis rosea]
MRALTRPRFAGPPSPACGRGFARLAIALPVISLILCAAWLSHAALSRAELVAPRASAIVYDRNGAFLSQIGEKIRDPATNTTHVDYGYWPLASIPQRMARATLALEDRRFYDHSGVDVRALLRAAWRNLTSRGRREGASTIAMQVARMQGERPRSFAEKLAQAATALAIIARNGHEATLAHYLRLAPYGLNGHGVAYAARFYFDKPVEDLSWAQAALLAAIPQSPGRMNITRESGLVLATARARHALVRLEEEGALDGAQAALARAELDHLRPLDAKRRPETLHLALRYEALAHEGLARPVAEGDRRINATIDLAVERDVLHLARRYLSNFRRRGARQVAVMVIERGTNAVIADVGSSDYNDPQAGAFDFTRVRRSPGSTLKPFIYALAFERGALKTTDLLNDIPEGASGVSNADGLYLGPLTPRQALANSRNVPATNLLRRVGLEANFSFLRDLGLHDLETPAESFGISMAIGALPTRLEDVMRAYAALADDGIMRDLAFTRDESRRPARRVLSIDSARLIASMLADPQARLPSFPRYGPLDYPFAVAVKTGTSQAYRDAWTIAFSHKFIVGVWLGRGDAGAMRAMTGVSSAARLAHAVLVKLHGAKPGDIAPEIFAPPPGRIAIDLCRAGDGADCAQTLREWVKPEDADWSQTQDPRPQPEEPQSGVSKDPETALCAPSAFEARLSGAPQGEKADRACDSPAMSVAPLVIATPEHNTHIWRNPEQPERFNRLALKLAPSGADAQIVWTIDGEPFATAQANETVFWPMTPGRHRIQARLALVPVASRAVKVVIE